MKDIGLYIHIPFCKSKCIYCDFTSYANKEKLIEDYIECVKKEIYYKSVDDYNVKTIYIGGGTPSYIDKEYIKEILYAIECCFIVDKQAEVSIEVNPGTVTKSKLRTFKSAGINRLSVGLQTANNKLLKELGRIHTYSQFENNIKIAQELDFDNINTDIMIGIPNQTIYDVEDALNKLIEQKINHISVYSLIYEENTKLYDLANDGKVKPIDEELERYMYWFAKRKLEENGYIHYEISNFAKPAYRCKHNVDCWEQKEYLGIGVGAASYEDDFRFRNTDSIEEYIRNISNDHFYKNVRIEEKQDKKEKMDEFMLLGLRMIGGVNVTKFREKFRENIYKVYQDTFKELINQELITIDTENIKLTNKGLDLANVVWEEFV